MISSKVVWYDFQIMKRRRFQLSNYNESFENPKCDYCELMLDASYKYCPICGNIRGEMFMSSVAKLVVYTMGILLFVAIMPLPLTYYTFLRYAISPISLLSFGIFLFTTSTFNSLRLNFRNSVFLLLGVIFNPWFPFELNKSTWTIIDFVFGSILMIILLIDLYHQLKSKR